jgi:drug/metabolite transporter (DMT)-like permease
MALTDNTRGALFMSASMAGFACNDALMKFAFETMPLAQSVFVRGLFASLFVGLMAWRAGVLAYRPRRAERGALALRTLGEIGATATFMVALANMPIANATAVLQAAPLGVTLVAAVLLAEPVGWRRWTAVIVGFGGVLLMIRPGTADFDWYAIVPMVTVGFIVLRDIATRRMSLQVPTLYASLLTAVSITLVAGAAAPFEGWAPLSLPIVAVLAGAAVFIICGYVFIVLAMRAGDVSAVAPFRYVILVWALILGYVVFGDVPGLLTLTGAAIVVAAGIYTLWRERKVGRGRAAQASHRPFAPRVEAD